MRKLYELIYDSATDRTKAQKLPYTKTITTLVVWAPIPTFPKLKCSVCGISKDIFDKEKDDVVIDTSIGLVKGKWYCANGHLNTL